jgi:ATP-binding cassette subfamily B multidrug efflux pump
MFGFFEKLVNPFPAAEVVRPPQGLRRFVWHCTEGVRPYIAAMAVCSAAIGVFDAFLFTMLGRVVDRLASIDPARLWIDAGEQLLYLALILLASPLLVGFSAALRWQTVAGNLLTRLRWHFHRLMLDQSMSFYQTEFAGRVSAKVMQTAMAVRDIVFILADALMFAGISFVAMVVVLASLEPWLLLPFIGYLLLYLLVLAYFVPRMTQLAQSQADERSLLTGRITDAYTNAATVKLFSHGEREASYARSAMCDCLHSLNGQNRLITASDVTLHSLNMLLVLSTAAMALWLWSHGSLGVGAIATATAMALRVNTFSHWIMWEMSSLLEQIGTVQDGVNTLSQANTVQDRPDAPALQVTRGEVCLEQVDFSYGGERRVLEQLSLQIRPGEKIGLVGRSGAGKSSILNLLLRLYDAESGRILIDGQDIAQVSQSSLRAQIGMVTQDTSLLHRSVRDNILYGRPDASEAEMIAAAKQAEAHEFILELGDPGGRSGYDAHVGERGVKLSGGQRQRIAIARAMLKDAPILLLDEATSALDSEVEAAIQASLYRLMAGKTVVAIAHRLSTIAAMDRLIVLDRGKIVEQGNHESLLAQGGLYASLWSRQSGGFLDETLPESEVPAPRPAGALSPDY